MTEELKPCIYCECDQIQFREEGRYLPFYRYCRNCLAQGPVAATYEEAEELWQKMNTITLDQAKQVLAEAGMVAVPVDDMTEIAKFVKCGIGGNYGGIYYTEKLREVYFPLLSSIEAAQEKPDA
jgi:hypothetical protein